MHSSGVNCIAEHGLAPGAGSKSQSAMKVPDSPSLGSGPSE